MSSLPKPLVSGVLGVACIALFTAFPPNASTAAAQETSDAAARRRAVERGIEYLRSKGQAADGSFTAQAGPGLTALCVTAALRNGRTLADPLVEKGLDYLEGFVQPDGGVYGGGRLKTYETCIAMVCFAEANKDGRYDKTLDNAEKFVKGLQFDEAKGRDESDVAYGGVGYGGPERPDLSNTSYMIDALRAAGNEPNDEAIQRALVFVSRCQNLESEHNATEFAAKINDGGFYYTVAAGGSSPAEGQTRRGDSERFDEAGGLRSYGSMTYSGLKSMVYAGLAADDPRVKAALDWIGKHYRVDENPGMGDAGLYYYYHTFAKALAAAGVDKLADADGDEHDWRADLSLELAKRQNADGSWSNANSRWFESDPNLATGFALLALSYCNEPK